LWMPDVCWRHEEVAVGGLVAPRRERKKQQTREALLHAALELFEAKGYEHTAIHEITDAVDVSVRTFFRYFASKEDLVLSFVRDATAALARALAARPPEEEPLTAIRQAFRQSLEMLTADSEIEGGDPTYLSVVKLIDATPTLLAANLRYAHEHSGELAKALAAREGVDPATDLRPRILASTYGALVVAANREWRTEGCTSVEAMLAKFDAYADQFGPGLFGRWNAEGGPGRR
jgi:AcrR family transcriptional regulator